MKICSKCKIKKDLSEFSKDKNRKDVLYCYCKKCQKIYREEKKEQILKQKQEYYKNNKEERLKYTKFKANYDTYAPQISYADKIRNIDGFLQVKCTYCGKWYFPTNQEIRDRIKALNGQVGNAENRLYCSTECKQECPIWHKILFQEGHPLKNENSSREVQPELRQMVFERDEYTCIKCGKHQDELLNVPLHCHHIEGVQQNPIMSADIDMCVTVCKDCHKEIHKEKNCGYNDMKCKK